MEHIRLFDLNNKRKIAVENVDIFASDGLLHELFEDEFGKQSIRYRKRIYTPEKTLAMFVEQKLSVSTVFDGQFFTINNGFPRLI